MRLSRWRWCFNGRVDEMRAREVVDAAHLWSKALPMVSRHQSLCGGSWRGLCANRGALKFSAAGWLGSTKVEVGCRERLAPKSN